MDAPNPSSDDPPGNLSFSLSFSELVNIAIPQYGVVNFKALQLVLHGILEHINMAKLKKVLSGDEDFLQTSQSMFMPQEGDGQPIVHPLKRLNNVFDHLVNRIEKVESQLTMLHEMPSTSMLLDGSQGTNRPAQELWQMIKLRKMVEGNEEALEKSMKTMQDLLTDVNTLKSATETLRKDVDMLKDMWNKEEELERVWGHQIAMMKDHYIVLDRAVEKIYNRLEEFKILQSQIRNLEMVKADKSAMEQELKEKADKSTLAAKASRVDLEKTSMELNEMIQGILLRMVSQEDDWKKTVDQLSKDLGRKLINKDLDNLKKDINEVWQIVKKLLIEGLRFDPDSAAGFRKKLFERVKCISCDRPVEMMTGP